MGDITSYAFMRLCSVLRVKAETGGEERSLDFLLVRLRSICRRVTEESLINVACRYNKHSGGRGPVV